MITLGYQNLCLSVFGNLQNCGYGADCPAPTSVTNVSMTQLGPIQSGPLTIPIARETIVFPVIHSPIEFPP